MERKGVCRLADGEPQTTEVSNTLLESCQKQPFLKKQNATEAQEKLWAAAVSGRILVRHMKIVNQFQILL